MILILILITPRVPVYSQVIRQEIQASGKEEKPYQVVLRKSLLKAFSRVFVLTFLSGLLAEPFYNILKSSKIKL